MKKLTQVFISIAIVIIIIYDIYAIVEGGTEASVSYVIIDWSYRFPAFTFLTGFTMGHLFWKIRAVKSKE